MRSSLFFLSLTAALVHCGRLSEEENLSLQSQCSHRLFRRILNADPIPAHDVIGQSAVAIVIHGHNKGVCSGTLISSRHILTASHCFRDNECSSSNSTIRVHVGAQCIDEESCRGTVVGVINYISYPGYFPSECTGVSKVGLDITVVELEQDVYNGVATVACLPSIAEIPMEMTGYAFGDKNFVLGRIGMIKWKSVECPKNEDANVLCAQPNKFEQNGCFGDSGHGALQIGIGSRPVIHGIFSKGASCESVMNMIELKRKGMHIKPLESDELFVSVYPFKSFICEASGVCG
ncbi:hypothetical protein PENTCL1PPCAC_11336 [Pristionchus entomophagus]|uniref:Peptidase S1 domain-containing protein n=1 Tax=Pristionchus entomophagus TaxID=358040 RepID=A0AAV5T100_9BILA|nr:hypothetical protein PENTCL1PPCAC_11336 [Pristionchus entomophagus]